MKQVNFLEIFKTVVSASVSMHQSTEERKKALALSKNNPYDEKLLEQINENELKMIEIQDFLVSVFELLGETLQENFDEIHKRFDVIEGLNNKAIKNYEELSSPINYEMAYEQLTGVSEQDISDLEKTWKKQDPNHQA